MLLHIIKKDGDDLEDNMKKSKGGFLSNSDLSNNFL